MAQAPSSKRLGLTRDQLASFLTDHEQIKQFESLFDTVDTEVSGGLVTEANVLAGTAYAMGNEALAGVAALNELVAPLVTAPPPTGGTVTSVAASGGTTGMSFSGSPITTSGTLVLGGTLSYTHGGTGLTATPANGQLLIGNAAGYTLSTLTAGTAISIGNASGSITITNTLPDQIVSLTGAGTTVVTGTYPNFTITSNDQYTGTVTSVGLSGGTTGLTVSGTNPITTSGTFTLGGTLAIANGGTNSSATPTAGGVAYGTGTAYGFTSAGTAGQYLTSTGSGTPTWSTISTPSIGQSSYYGSFYDTTATQVAANTTTAYAIKIGQTAENNGVTIVSGDRITFAHSGVYNVQYSIQFTNTDSSIHNVNVWLRKNGSDVADTNSQYAIISSHGGIAGQMIAAINYVLTVTAGDYLQLMWQTENVQVFIETIAAGTSPTTPVSPGIIVTACNLPDAGIGYAGLTSTTSMSIGTGSKSFTVSINSANSAFVVGNRVRLIYDSTNYMEGTITAYSGTSMTVNVDTTAGSGTYSAWTIGLTGVVNTGVTSFSGGSTGLTPNTATSGAISLAGTLGVGYGGTGTATAFTAGSLVFAGSSGVYSQNNSQLFWDNSSFRLGIGNASPGAALDVTGNIRLSAANPNIEFNNGGPMVYAPAANTLGFATGGGPGSPIERFRVGSAGQWGIAGATYGSAGQVFTSGGASAAPTWTTPTTGTVTSVSGTGTVNGITLTGTVTTSGSLTLGGTLSGVSLTSQVSGTLPVANGGTGTSTAFTTGSVVFANSGGTYAQKNANFFWDNTNNRLGIGTASPAANIDSRGVVSIGGAADASLHISQVYGGNGRLSQMSVNSNSTDALNIIASKNGGGSEQWYSYGVTAANVFNIQQGVGLGTAGLNISSNNQVLINTNTVSGASLNHTLEANGDIMSTGSAAGLFWANRSAAPSPGANWYGWYTTGGTIYLYNPAAGNIASINASTGAYTALSDAAKKKDFEPSSIGLDAVMALKPTLFRMETDDAESPKQLGFIAQEVKDHIPQAYVEEQNVDAVGNESVYIGLNDRPIIAALVKAVQELTARVAELEGK